MAPVVKVTADPTSVLLGDSVVLECNVIRGNPSKYNYTWRNSDGVLSTGINSTWFIASVNDSDIDTYTCEVENSVGQRGQDSIAIRFGSKYIDSHLTFRFWLSDCSKLNLDTGQKRTFSRKLRKKHKICSLA